MFPDHVMTFHEGGYLRYIPPSMKRNMLNVDVSCFMARFMVLNNLNHETQI